MYFRTALLLSLGVLLLPSCGTPQFGSRLPKTSEGRHEPADEWLVLEPPRLADANADLYLTTLATVFGDEHGEVGGCFQTLTLPENGPEEIVFVDCAAEQAGQPARVVRMVANEDVSAKLQSDGFDRASKVAAQREESLLDADDSRLLRELWWKMLERAKLKAREDIRGVPRYYFSACKALVGCRGAVGLRPHGATLAGRLVELSQLLSRLPHAEPAERAELLRTLRTRAAALSAALKNAQQAIGH